MSLLCFSNSIELNVEKSQKLHLNKWLRNGLLSNNFKDIIKYNVYTNIQSSLFKKLYFFQLFLTVVLLLVNELIYALF